MKQSDPGKSLDPNPDPPLFFLKTCIFLLIYSHEQIHDINTYNSKNKCTVPIYIFEVLTLFVS